MEGTIEYTRYIVIIIVLRVWWGRYRMKVI